MLAALLWTAVTRPLRWLRAAFLALRMGSAVAQGRLRHLVYLAEACVLAPPPDGVPGPGTCTPTLAPTPPLSPCWPTCSAALPTASPSTVPEEFDRPESLSLRDKIERAAFVVAVSEYGRSQVFRWCDQRHWGKSPASSAVESMPASCNGERAHPADQRVGVRGTAVRAEGTAAAAGGPGAA